ncbi:MAG TPA: 16S rRNA (cytosine(1402)-N(4))-methyltransferase RsmH [bacterium]|nr:16S rRNA (cytosine(1402)-N(4))-methyltransferase RsmH [bacterium]
MISISSFAHKAVMLDEVLNVLLVKPGGRYIDCTLGSGGHSYAILDASNPDGILVGIDMDPYAIDEARRNLSFYGDRFIPIQGNFVNLIELVSRTGIDKFDGILFDLGISSIQLDNSERGFSFNKDGPLDMRMDPSIKITAHQIVNSFPMEKLESIFREFGEERSSYKIARAIVEYRKKKEISTTKELADLISSVVKRKTKIHPATRVFMALRIYINNELDNLRNALEQAVCLLKPGGRLCVISYHSLEDRIVKRFFKGSGCRIIGKSVITPTRDEILVNRRARSAKLRGLEKL